MASNSDQKRTPRSKVITNSEGFQIPQTQPLSVRLRDRVTFTLIGVLNLIAVGVIAKQLKSFGLLPQYIDTDFTGVRFATQDPLRRNCRYHAACCMAAHSDLNSGIAATNPHQRKSQTPS